MRINFNAGPRKPQGVFAQVVTALVGAVVLDAAAYTTGHVLAEQVGQLCLALGDVRMVRHKRSPESRCAVFAVR